ncbi:glycosyl hydrolase family 61-domain-containing protein [Hypoxylon rubiginosum]|uniref:Glycosyl hydrolase family 61-domain-containing protein n=1 Tax=Hypoxylon rubiginosum TaxID=110542 RepID=A0ACC0CW70_9PEZI|nr:glycosyl hydrolase family 61-domain-containing protein [Hypoxylon rubiginosum]
MLPKTAVGALALFSSAPTVLAHWTYSRLIVNDAVVGAPWQYIRHHNNSNNPLTNANGTEFRCNIGAQPSETYTVRAGDELGFSVDEHFGHPGIQQVYLSKAPEGVAAAEYDGVGGWARIYSLTSAPKNASGDGSDDEEEVLTWATDNIQSFRFPLSASTPPGEYLLRAEGLALHAAHKRDNAQFYVSCAQIKVVAGNATAGARGEPGPLLPIPGMYRGDDPGVLIPVFWSYLTNYTAPGPPLWPEGTVEQHEAKVL